MEFHSNGMEYEVSVDAYTGAINEYSSEAMEVVHVSDGTTKVLVEGIAFACTYLFPSLPFSLSSYAFSIPARPIKSLRS